MLATNTPNPNFSLLATQQSMLRLTSSPKQALLLTAVTAGG